MKIRDWLIRCKGEVVEVGRLVCTHTIALPLFSFLASLTLWMLAHSALLLAGLGIGLSVWATAIAVLVNTGTDSAKRRKIVILLSVVSVMCSVIGTCLLAQSGPPAATCPIPNGCAERLLFLAGQAPVDDPNVVPDNLLQLQVYLSRTHQRKGAIRVELTKYDPQAKTLRLPNRYYVQGWVSDVVRRTYPIPGVTLGGATSVAGTAFVDRHMAYVEDTWRSLIARIFDDPAERTCGETRCILSDPIIIEGGKEPWGVLSVTSIHPRDITTADFELLHLYAGAFASYFARMEQSQKR